MLEVAQGGGEMTVMDRICNIVGVTGCDETSVCMDCDENWLWACSLPDIRANSGRQT